MSDRSNVLLLIGVMQCSRKQAKLDYFKTELEFLGNGFPAYMKLQFPEMCVITIWPVL